MNVPCRKYLKVVQNEAVTYQQAFYREEPVNAQEVIPLKKEMKADKVATCSSCGCSGYGWWIVLIVAILFLLRDIFGMTLFGISGWTVILFIIAFGMKYCQCK